MSKSKQIAEKLFQITKDEYGEKYRDHLIEQYKLYVEMADRISSRRQTAHSFFISLNTAIIALISYVKMNGSDATSFYCLIAFSGMVLAFMWYRLIRSYRDLNSAKFEVVHEIEARLPISPYDAEWEAVGRGMKPKLYLPFSHIEIYVPWIFFIIHFVVFLMCMLGPVVCNLKA